MLKDFLKKNGWRYVPGAIFLVLCAWLSTRSPIFLGNAIDQIKLRNWEAFLQQIGWMIAAAGGVFVTRFIWRYFIVFTARKLEFYLKDRLFHHLQLLPLRFYGSHRSGDLMAYAINDTNAVRLMFGVVFAQVLNSLSSLLFSVSSMAQLASVKLTVFSLLPVPLAAAAVLLIGRQIRVRFRRVQELFSSLSGHVQENINGMRVLKAFAQEKGQYADYEAESMEKYTANMRLYRISALLDPVISILFGLSFMIGLVYGGMLVIEKEITLGQYVSFNTFLTNIVQPILSLGRVSNNLQRGLASYKRLSAIMNEEEIPEFDRQDDGRPIEGDLKVSHLTFAYPGTDKTVLEDVSFELKRGNTLGVVGPTGSGKSTLMQLLIKLLPVPEGSIAFGGRDLTQIPAASVRNIAGYVPQDGFLFDVSLKENIDFYAGKSMEEIQAAARIAGLEKDIAQMPEGYDTVCGERGNHLSGGQRQRASLARALVRDPELLLLDDTLSAVDAHTEGQILSALSGELKGRTAVIIAHRLTAVKNAAEILYMDKGRVLERGTHEQLLAKNGAYAEMWRKQQREEESA